MKKRLEQLLKEAEIHKAELESKASMGSFAYQQASKSMSSHIDELNQQLAFLNDRPSIESLELRLQAPQFNSGSIPLQVIARAADELRQMIGYAALRLSQGGLGRKRIPEALYEELDLRLAGILPGSTRLMVTLGSQRDLFGDGISKNALDRVFSVLESQGTGERFLQSVTDLGPSSAKHLRNFLSIITNNSANLDLTWTYSGANVKKWEGDRDSIAKVESALDHTELTSKDEIQIEGVIELLSKRERIQIVTDSGYSLRVLYSKRHLQLVSELHLDQKVKLKCSVTETVNSATGETSIFYELIEIVK